MSRFVVVLLTVLAVLAVAYAAFAALARPRPVHPYFEGLARPTVLAHAGGDHLWPGNTLIAFERARALGVDVLELDINASRDGELVVIHDATVDRTTEGSGAVKEMTLAQLQELDAAYNWSPPAAPGSYPYRGTGVRIPTLREVFEAFPDTHVNVELKQLEPSIAGPTCNLIREYGRETSVMVGSFHNESLREFRRLCPEVATSAGPAEVRNLFILSRAFLGSLWRPVADALQVPEYRGSLHLVTPSFVRAAQNKNVQVQVWTPNETEELEELLALGVDGLITDRPDRALRLSGRGGNLKLPEGTPD